MCRKGWIYRIGSRDYGELRPTLCRLQGGGTGELVVLFKGLKPKEPVVWLLGLKAEDQHCQGQDIRLAKQSPQPVESASRETVSELS